MRMWLVDPKIMCRKHLLGEHEEMHMFVGAIKKGTSLKGYIENGLVEVHMIKYRHDSLAEEMIRRGYNHKSPIGDISYPVMGFIDIEKSKQELLRRCPDCKEI